METRRVLENIAYGVYIYVYSIIVYLLYVRCTYCFLFMFFFFTTVSPSVLSSHCSCITRSRVPAVDTFFYWVVYKKKKKKNYSSTCIIYTIVIIITIIILYGDNYNIDIQYVSLKWYHKMFQLDGLRLKRGFFFSVVSLYTICFIPMVTRNISAEWI